MSSRPMKAIVVGEFKPETRRPTFRDGSLTLWAARNEGVVNGKRQAKRPWILLMTPPGALTVPTPGRGARPSYTRRITIAHPGVAHQWERGVLCAPACGQPFPGQSYGGDGHGRRVHPVSDPVGARPGHRVCRRPSQHPARAAARARRLLLRAVGPSAISSDSLAPRSCRSP
jgi:hypothetical protein